jgi:hypothetical protein
LLTRSERAGEVENWMLAKEKESRLERAMVKTVEVLRENKTK